MSKQKKNDKISLYSIFKEHNLNYAILNRRIDALGIEVYWMDNKETCIKKKTKHIKLCDLDRILKYVSINNSYKKESPKDPVMKHGSAIQNDNRKAGYYTRITAIGRMRTEQGLKHV